MDRKPLHLLTVNFGITLEFFYLFIFLSVRSFFVVHPLPPGVPPSDAGPRAPMNQTPKSELRHYNTSPRDLNNNRGARAETRGEMMTINDNRNWKMKCNSGRRTRIYT